MRGGGAVIYNISTSPRLVHQHVHTVVGPTLVYNTFWWDCMVHLHIGIPRGLARYLFAFISVLAIVCAQSQEPTAVGQAADIRGVNLGGWFVTEPCEYR
jgi:hypothetical protein